MKRWHKVLIVLFGGLAILIAAVALLTRWMNRWGATDEEIAAEFPGDELVPDADAHDDDRAAVVGYSSRGFYDGAGHAVRDQGAGRTIGCQRRVVCSSISA